MNDDPAIGHHFIKLIKEFIGLNSGTLKLVGKLCI